ncbi:cytochrome c biogenesis protein ResB [Geobacter pickeringii]|uniref:ResB-like domain-containing protein n=1 Tax=Geobacter pickeringii TaxID=345632 RepID=A0A0B5BEI7_9BACT|nr:hypothetical protein [Geobacter pickeringii]AJE02476.1 hypothetical protein GPICK_02950 [Geobacter pickeringii]
MNEFDTPPGIEPEHYPIEPHYHPLHKIPRKIYDFLASAKLAMVLLVAILVFCVAGVTLYRGARAWELIFSTIWFNGLLVLLVANIACCFFGRIWHRRLTLITLGMILFHLSFVAILGGVVYNSLFYFRGLIRLTEGEVLPSGDPQSYDQIDKGRFFNFSRLKGETSLIKMHAGYTVGGEDKRAAYEVAVGEEGDRSRGIIYITHKLTHRGFDYFNDREGYSLLVTLADREGRELYGAHLPLQSIRQSNNSYYYTTGYKDGGTVKAGAILFPYPPEKPRFALQASYRPSPLKERGGEVWFQLFPLDKGGGVQGGAPVAEGRGGVGDRIAVGDYILSAREVRYWVVMQVRHEPGKPVVLTSLWVALGGMLLTTVGRMTRRSGSAKGA